MFSDVMCYKLGYAHCWFNHRLHFWFTEVTAYHLLWQMSMPLKQWIVLHMKIVTTKLRVRIILMNAYYSVLKAITKRILMMSQLMSLISLFFLILNTPHSYITTEPLTFFTEKKKLYQCMYCTLVYRCAQWLPDLTMHNNYWQYVELVCTLFHMCWKFYSCAVIWKITTYHATVTEYQNTLLLQNQFQSKIVS